MRACWHDPIMAEGESVDRPTRAFLLSQLPVGVEVALESLPCLIVVVLDLSALLDSPVCRLELH